ncbi:MULTISPECIES: hypothetical protein [unclassified Sphingomonas]|jgi:hypothetical protein|uniref:hypothetical protein n=1 Tax=unclassified Sphingomonas TaxID=196159 RepID=UPI000AB84A02|nr:MULTISPECIES: hypothetical protein [unclassified Sphingomonas]
MFAPRAESVMASDRSGAIDRRATMRDATAGAFVDRLCDVVARLDGMPDELLGDDWLTASVYVDAAARSLRFAAETMRADDVSGRGTEDGDEEVDPRLLEWLA